jgi:hypothetical protein
LPFRRNCCTRKVAEEFAATITFSRQVSCSY